MIARLQQFMTINWLLAIVGWFWWAWANEYRTAAVLGAVFLATLHAGVLGLELVLQYFVSRQDAIPPASPRALLKAWAAECITGLHVFCLRQPFQHDAEADFLPPPSGRRGVLLVHGLVCNRGVWTPWLRALRQRGVPVLAPSFEPPFGLIESWAPGMDAAVRRLHAATGQPVLIVAHSLGGLAVRAWLRGGGDKRLVSRVITIASPHRGTWLARFGTTPNARQLQLGSPWLQALERDEAAAPHGLPMTCFFSDCDNVVFPPSVATLPGAENRLLRGWAHVDLLDAPELLETVLQHAGDKPGGDGGASRRAAPPAAR